MLILRITEMTTREGVLVTRAGLTSNHENPGVEFPIWAAHGERDEVLDLARAALSRALREEED